MSVEYGTVTSPDPLKMTPEDTKIVVLFDDNDMIEHAWYCYDIGSGGRDRILHGSSDAFVAYGTKVEELIAVHGQPDIATVQDGSDLTYATGLAYADVTDFGDGLPRLVVCYLDKNACKDFEKPGAYPEDYKVEVWEYSDQGLQQVYSGTAQLDGQNTYCGVVLFNEHDGRKTIQTWGGQYGGPEGDITYRVYGLDDANEFALLNEVRFVFSKDEREYTMNGAPISAEENKAVSAEWYKNENRTTVALSSLKNNRHTPWQLIRNTNKVVAVLEACAAGA